MSDQAEPVNEGAGKAVGDLPDNVVPEGLAGGPTSRPAPTIRPGRPTMKDVARVAGVSIKTVSRVVNEEGNVRSNTMERVNAAIDELGFQRNDLARSLRPGQATSTLGLVVGDIGNPYFAGIVGGVEDVARGHGYMVLAGSSGENPTHERELVSMLTSRRVDGIIVVPAGEDHRHLHPDQLRGIPVVFVDRPPVGIDADTVRVDDRGVAREGISALLDDGHRRVALLADHQETHTARQRLAGYLDAFRDHDLAVVNDLLRTDCGDVDGAEKATRELFDEAEPPSAVFTINNRMSLGALRAMRRHGHPVPLLGFDDLEFVDLVTGPITLIDHDPRVMGRQAAELLFERLQEEVEEVRHVVLPTSLIMRAAEEQE